MSRACVRSAILPTLAAEGRISCRPARDSVDERANLDYDGPRDQVGLASVWSEVETTVCGQRECVDVGAPGVLERVEAARIKTTRQLDRKRRALMGQFLTPAPIAGFMASMLSVRRRSIRLLDAGAGIGSLTAAFVDRVCQSEVRPERLEVVAYEVDPMLAEHLRGTAESCAAACRATGIDFDATVLEEDFVQAGAELLNGSLFGPSKGSGFDCAILNPPYRKIRSDSRERRLLRSIGVETVNLYAGFLAITIKLLRRNGQLVALTPRSFCNGPYYRPFRRLLLRAMRLQRLHVFERRDEAFRDDNVLQEHLIIHAVKGAGTPSRVIVSSSEDGAVCRASHHQVDYEELVAPGDQEQFIHVITDVREGDILRRMNGLAHTLDDLQVEVSTGRVVDFRAKEFLRQRPSETTAPLVYPAHFHGGRIQWPKYGSRKPNAIEVRPQTEDLLVPSGTYVLVKRFSAKEQARRIVAAVCNPSDVPCPVVAFENHLNYYHRKGTGLPPVLAHGLAAFLNSTVFDRFFRSFSGHTQVNATDLRRMRYPSPEQLCELGSVVGREPAPQTEIDRLARQYLHV